MATYKEVLSALSVIIDPDFQRDIVSLGFIKQLTLAEERVSFSIELTTPACPLKDQFKAEAERVVAALPGVSEVAVTMTARKRPPRQLADGSGLSAVAGILAVSSCKGGVGKSTVAAILACELSRRGYAVGLLDADIFGPSVPSLFNEHDVGLAADARQYWVPRERQGLKLMSFGFLAGDQPAVMRGPMVSGVIRQMLHQVAWGALDYLIIDMPPGTGDIQLTISQSAQLDAALIVTTPHQLSLADVRKGILMFDKVDVPVIGVVENMAYFLCTSCDARHEIFGPPMANQLEERFGLETLAQIPVTTTLSAPLASILATPAVGPMTDAVMRAFGQETMRKRPRPEIASDAESITLTWPDAPPVRVGNRALRQACHCALCIDEMTSKPLLDPTAVPADIHATEVSLIGNYAIAVTWSDGHNTGFYPFRQIRELAGGRRKTE